MWGQRQPHFKLAGERLLEHLLECSTELHQVPDAAFPDGAIPSRQGSPPASKTAGPRMNQATATLTIPCESTRSHVAQRVALRLTSNR